MDLLLRLEGEVECLVLQVLETYVYLDTVKRTNETSTRGTFQRGFIENLRVPTIVEQHESLFI